jgi:hypothetical protein
MKARLAALIGALRTGGVPVSVAEAIDAASAAAAAGVERGRLADALAASLIKDEGDRLLFDECFARVFPIPSRPRARRARRAATGARGSEQGGEGGGGRRRGDRGTAGRPRDDDDGAAGGQDDDRGTADGRRGNERETATTRRPGGARDAATGQTAERDRGGAASAQRRDAARQRALRTMPFRAMSPRDVEDAAALVRVLARQVSARLRRRLQPRRAGRLDFRRTLRAATAHGGVPVERHFRGRRPRRPVLVALCDLSASAATATDFFLAVLVPARAHFARVRLFGFVDRLVEIEFVDGAVRPAAPIDLMARSDFGRVLRDLAEEGEADLTADTVLLVLGDARNNRLPPRADLLRETRARVRRVVWLNPEPRERWNTGDSVIDLYARHADVVVPCGSPAELAAAVAEVARRS